LRKEIMQVMCDFCMIRMMRVPHEAAEREESDENTQDVVRNEFTREAFPAYADEYMALEKKTDRPFDGIDLIE
jgi:hypothetical protein